MDQGITFRHVLIFFILAISVQLFQIREQLKTGGRSSNGNWREIQENIDVRLKDTHAFMDGLAKNNLNIREQLRLTDEKTATLTKDVYKKLSDAELRIAALENMVHQSFMDEHN
tara:strand:+ start:1141 stop:1482 length:342 start_codon:yes stop_codon:yes gene_type:complete